MADSIRLVCKGGPRINTDSDLIRGAKSLLYQTAVVLPTDVPDRCKRQNIPGRYLSLGGDPDPKSPRLRSPRCCMSVIDSECEFIGCWPVYVFCLAACGQPGACRRRWFSTEWPLHWIPEDHPRGVIVDDWGNVYIADTAHSQIVRVTRAGIAFGLVMTGLSTGLSAPEGLALDGSGNL